MADAATNSAYVTAEWIRRPLPDLGGVSPSDAAADAEGRKKLEDLFTELAGHHVRLTNLGLPAIDPAELRKALGLEATAHVHARQPARAVRMGPVKRNALLDELGTALTGGDVDSVAFFNVKTGAVEHFMHNLGDQETARIAEAQANADMRKIAPVTTDVRYGIMSDFIGLVEDINVAGRLRSAISGKGAFRRFREAVDEDDALRRRWLSYRTKRHYLLALDWMQKLGVAPEQYNIAPAEYDWHPSASETAAAPAAQAAGPAATAETAAAGPPADAPADAETPPNPEEVMEEEGGIPSAADSEPSEVATATATGSNQPQSER
ncbi:MAG TPA: UPF0158 family protein [Candidatus Eremiobacteraceae bacterium]|nr:UPF0158 family protein [Candidatus Eremiobacteraceae bacterium]